jgi:hypothetical protein
MRGAFEKEHGGKSLLERRACGEWLVIRKYVKIAAVVWPETEETSRPFKWYVDKLSVMKNQQDELSAKGSSEYNPALRDMIKLSLNALSGKVIQKNYNTHFKLIRGGKELNEIVDKLAGVDGGVIDDVAVRKLLRDLKLCIEYVTTDVNGFDYGNVVWEEGGYGKNSKPSHMGVFTYAYARAYMYDNVYARCKVWYSDTDSALISVEDYRALDSNIVLGSITGVDIKSYKFVETHKKEFGKLEIEKIGGVWLFDRAVVISPKTYSLWRGGKVIKYRAKGVRKSDSFVVGGVKKSIEAHKEEFFELLLKGKVEVHSWNFKRKWGSGLGVSKNDLVKLI